MLLHLRVYQAALLQIRVYQAVLLQTHLGQEQLINCFGTTIRIRNTGFGIPGSSLNQAGYQQGLNFDPNAPALMGGNTFDPTVVELITQIIN